MIGLIPCAGSASRLSNIPKFMLPCFNNINNDINDNNNNDNDDNNDNNNLYNLNIYNSNVNNYNMNDSNTNNSQMSLLSKWIHLLFNKNCSKIIIAVSPTTLPFVEHIINTQFNNYNKIKNIISIKNVSFTSTMNETILSSLINESYNCVIMCMPDTYVSNISTDFINKFIDNNDINCAAYLWNIRQTQLGKIGQCNINDNYIVDIIDKDINCPYIYGWGVVMFKPFFVDFILNDESHIGYSMKNYIKNNNIIYNIEVNDLYFDCGTIDGYHEYLNYNSFNSSIHIKGTIIIVAVYINNDENNYNILIDCLTKLRNIYKNEFIITVNNSSINTNWIPIANKLNMTVLHNNSILHRFEMGAYKLALQHFRADNYICIQGTIQINNILNLDKLNNNIPSVLPFNKISGLHWSETGLKFINNLLNVVNLNNWNNNDLVLWNCFCCNDKYVNLLFDNGLFDLPSNTKNHSCAFERILGVFNDSFIGKTDTIDPNSYNKIFLCQNNCTF